jgi:hypothetical protein
MLQQVRIVQRIITPQGAEEVEMVPNPYSWYKGKFPTSVRIEGDLPPELLEWLIEEAALYGWRYWPEEKKFIPTGEEE